ncbi:MAG: bile acid:sodium symporter family protein [Pseudomonadota bacterium]
MLLRVFPFLAVLAALIGYVSADQVSLARPAIVPLLMLVMLAMGLTLRWQDFAALQNLKSAFLLGLSLQFLAMPLLATGISIFLQLDPELRTGMLLVGSVAGGTASNVMAFLAHGNVALSVAMTATSTLASIALTPLWMLLLSEQSVEIPAWPIFKALLQIILLPVFLGVLMNRFLADQIKALESWLAGFAMLTVAIIIAIVVSLNASRLGQLSYVVLLAPLLHNLAGLSLGYYAAQIGGFDASVRRTIALEVGMQNSGLAAALALKFFSPMAAVPGAIFSVWLNVTGALFASLSTRQDRKRN